MLHRKRENKTVFLPLFLLLQIILRFKKKNDVLLKDVVMVLNKIFRRSNNVFLKIFEQKFIGGKIVSWIFKLADIHDGLIFENQMKIIFYMYIVKSIFIKENLNFATS